MHDAVSFPDSDPVPAPATAQAELSLGKVLGSHKVSHRSIERQLDCLNNMVSDYLTGNRAGQWGVGRDKEQGR